MERHVIISGHKGRLISELERMINELREHSEGSFYVSGNGSYEHDLALRFSCEIAPEFAEPCVDYEES